MATTTEDPLSRFRCEACLQKLRTGDCVEGRYRLCNACAESIAEWFRTRFTAKSPSPEVEPDPIEPKPEPAGVTQTQLVNEAAKERGLKLDPKLRVWANEQGEHFDARPGPVFVKLSKPELQRLQRKQGK